MDVKKESVRKIEESLVSLILKNEGMITKKDILEQEIAPLNLLPNLVLNPADRHHINQNTHQNLKLVIRRLPTRVKPEQRKDQIEKHLINQNIHRNQNKDKTIPDFFKFDNINITFKDE